MATVYRFNGKQWVSEVVRQRSEDADAFATARSYIDGEVHTISKFDQKPPTAPDEIYLNGRKYKREREDT